MKHSEVGGKISEIGFDFDYDAKKIWQLNLPTEEIEIEQLIWLIEIPFWSQNNGQYNLSPSEVINDPQKYSRKYNKIINSDLSYPIHIIYWKNRWMILDGLHRLTKAYINRLDKIKVKIVKEEIILMIAKSNF